MIEVFFVLYLFSGVIKAYLETFRVDLGIDFTLLTGSLLLALVAVRLFRNESFNSTVFRVLKSKMLIALLTFWCWMLLTLFYTRSETYSSYKVLAFGTNFIAFFVPLVLGKMNFRLVGRSLIALTFICGLVFFFLYPITLYGSPSDYFFLDFGAFRGQYQAVGILTSLSIIYILNQPIQLWRVITLNMLLWLIIYSGSRGGIIFLVLIILGLFLFRFNDLRKWISSVNWSLIHVRQLLITLFILMVLNGLYVSVIYDNSFTSKVHYRSFARLGLVYDSLLKEEERENTIEIFNFKPTPSMSHQDFVNSKSEDRNTSINARLYHIKFSYSHITSSIKTFFFGYGVGSYGKIYTGEDSRGYPHNILIETWFEMGLVGVVLLVLFMILVVKNMKFDNVYIMAMLVFMALNVLKSSSLIDLRVFFGFLALTAITNASRINSFR
ncbi:MAG: O-antigen ligase family protein [Salibacteraceae bacterium]